MDKRNLRQLTLSALRGNCHGDVGRFGYGLRLRDAFTKHRPGLLPAGFLAVFRRGDL